GSACRLSLALPHAGNQSSRRRATPSRSRPIPTASVSAAAADNTPAPPGGTGTGPTPLTAIACAVRADGPPLRLMVWPVKTWVVEVPPLLVSVTVAVYVPAAT